MQQQGAPLSPGKRLGSYEIVRLLRLGGMGELYLARRAGIEGFEKEVAIKRILPQFASDPIFERMLLHEARLMATLQHPNIVQVFDADRIDGVTFFAMEYVHGESLYGVLKEAAGQNRGLSMGNALFIVGNVAAGLHYAHQRKRSDGTPLELIHRDVSPNNIMIGHQGSVKLVDFGVAKAIAKSIHTAPGAIKGNIRYLSPEQCLGQPLDGRSDIFSLGIVLFELTTGTRWIREKDDYQSVQKMLNEPLPLPSSRRANYPRALESIVMKALAKNPADRFANAQQLQVALEEFAREQRLSMSSVTMANTMQELFGARSIAPPASDQQDVQPEPPVRVKRFGPTGTVVPQSEPFSSRGIPPTDPPQAPTWVSAGASLENAPETFIPKTLASTAPTLQTLPLAKVTSSAPAVQPSPDSHNSRLDHTLPLGARPPLLDQRVPLSTPSPLLKAAPPAPPGPSRKSPLDQTLPLGETLESLNLTRKRLEPPKPLRVRGLLIALAVLVVALMAAIALLMLP